MLWKFPNMNKSVDYNELPRVYYPASVAINITVLAHFYLSVYLFARAYKAIPDMSFHPSPCHSKRLVFFNITTMPLLCPIKLIIPYSISSPYWNFPSYLKVFFFFFCPGCVAQLECHPNTPRLQNRYPVRAHTRINQWMHQ